MTCTPARTSAQAWFALVAGVLTGFVLLAALYCLVEGDRATAAVLAACAAPLVALLPIRLRRR